MLAHAQAGNQAGDQLDGFRKLFRFLALGISFAGAFLAADFGFHQSDTMGVAVVIAFIFVCLGFASDYIWLFVLHCYSTKNYRLAGVLTLGGVLVFSLHLLASVGSVGWQRDVTITEARMQNTRADMAGDQVTEARGSLDMWQKRLTLLETANAWAGSVTAEALRAELPVKDEAIRQEEARGGCGPKCLKLRSDKAGIEKRIGIVEERANLTKQIEATKKIIAGYRTQAAGTERAVAAPASQAKFFASVASLSLTPSETAEVWTTRGIGGWVALGICAAPILFGLIGWGTVGSVPAQPRITHAAEDRGQTSTALVVEHGSAAPAPSALKIVQQHFDDTRFAQHAADVLRKFRPATSEAALPA